MQILSLRLAQQDVRVTQQEHRKHRILFVIYKKATYYNKTLFYFQRLKAICSKEVVVLSSLFTVRFVSSFKCRSE